MVFVTKIEDIHGNILEKNGNSIEKKISEETAFLITDAMRDVVDHGTGVRAKVIGRPSAGKTGTTNDSKDAWYIGFIPQLLTGVYVGYDNPKKLGKHETGSKTALPIFKEFIKNAVNNYEARPFKIAKGIKMMVIDAETGKKADFSSKKTIIESYKKEKIENQQIISNDKYNSSILKKNILKFY